jgi:hypothetical protein
MNTLNKSGSGISYARYGGGAGLAVALVLALTCSADAQNNSAAIPLSEIGAKATADYHGDALGVVATAEGARLKCGFQKLEGQATAEGLWLESSAAGGGKFRLMAGAVGRRVAGGQTSNIQHRTSNWRLLARLSWWARACDLFGPV